MSFKWLDNQVAGEVSMQVSNPIQYGGSNLTYFSPITLQTLELDLNFLTFSFDPFATLL